MTRPKQAPAKARHDDSHQRPKPVGDLEPTLDEISTLLNRIYTWLPQIRALTVDRGDRMAFIDPATRQAMGRQHARERRELREATAAGMAIGPGVSRAPGDLTVVSLEGRIVESLRGLITFVLDREPTIVDERLRQERAVLQLAGRAPWVAGETAISRLRTAAMGITTAWVAEAVRRDLEALVELVRRALFAEDRRMLGACPHCRNDTLVVYKQTGIVRCERPRDDDGRTAPCVCDPEDPVSQMAGASALCPCHADPRRFEHHWYRDRPGSHQLSWQGALAPALIALRTSRQETP